MMERKLLRIGFESPTEIKGSFDWCECALLISGEMDYEFVVEFSWRVLVQYFLGIAIT